MGTSPNKLNVRNWGGKLDVTETGTTGLLHLGTLQGLNLDKIVETISLESGESGRLELFEEIKIRDAVTLNFQITEWQTDTLKMIFSDEDGATASTQAVATSQSDTITGIKGKGVRLTKRNLDPSSIAVATAAATAAVEGTDYRIDTDLGIFYFLAGSDFADGTEFEVTYDAYATAINTLKPLTKESTVSLDKVLLRLRDHRGNIIEWEADNASLSLSGNISFDAGAISTIPATIRLLRDNNDAQYPFGQLRSWPSGSVS